MLDPILINVAEYLIAIRKSDDIPILNSEKPKTLFNFLISTK